jgi:hypothetical protein
VQIFGSEKVSSKNSVINEEHKQANFVQFCIFHLFSGGGNCAAAGIGLLVWYGSKGVSNLKQPLLLSSHCVYHVHSNVFQAHSNDCDRDVTHWGRDSSRIINY